MFKTAAHQTKQKTMPVSHFKVLEGEGEGIATMIVSVFNNVDHAKDRVIPGAFAKSLKRKLPKGVWSHDWDRPIAKTLEAKELFPGDALLPPELMHLGGLWIKAQFNLETQDGRDAYSNLKGEFIDEFSFGYDTIVQSWNSKDKCNDLKELDILEWSPVLAGCNPATRLLSVKERSADGRKSQYLGLYAEASATADTLRSLSSCLMYNAVYDFLFDDDEGETVEERLADLTGAFDEFRDISLRIVRAMFIGEEGAEKASDAARNIKAHFTPDDVSSLADGKFSTQIEAARAAVETCLLRAKAIKAIRQKDNRGMSAERHTALTELKVQFDALIEETKPVAEEEPAPAVDTQKVLTLKAKFLQIQAETL